jgi:two-component sensor histidine kinase
VNELVTNSIKYAFNNSHHGKVNVVLKACKMQHQWQLMVSDNGVGLPITQERREGSLGLKLVQIMTKQIKGVLSTSNDDGAVFNIIFSVLNSKK